ncbi:hypothetical protein H6785_03135 [Candidatus Nomurabacteria bacterium]|nr:hypothetical protein [Candidatus Kaiserbacteria bacterium]MCB9815541.1 hypothetical protein [Candidatus Nomurabacteria bacterium]
MSEKAPNNITQKEKTETAVASLETARVLEEAGFPESWDVFTATSPEELKEMREFLEGKVQEFAFNEDGEVIHENHRLVENISQRLAVIDALLSSTSFEVEAQKIFNSMTPV